MYVAFNMDLVIDTSLIVLTHLSLQSIAHAIMNCCYISLTISFQYKAKALNISYIQSLSQPN